jgi:hypothetical protein
VEVLVLSGLGITLSVKISMDVDSDELLELELELDDELVNEVEFEYPAERGLNPE